MSIPQPQSFNSHGSPNPATLGNTNPPHSVSGGDTAVTIGNDTTSVLLVAPGHETERDGNSPPGNVEESERPIPKPPFARNQVKLFYSAIGISIMKNRKPIHRIINDVWKSHPDWATTEHCWGELEEESRNAAEEELQQRLEAVYPAADDRGKRIRRSRAWLARCLLAEKHRARGKPTGAARSRGL